MTSYLDTIGAADLARHDVFLESGVVRGGGAEVRLHARDSAAGALRLVAVGVGGAELATAPLNAQGGGSPGLAALDGRLDLAGLGAPVLAVEVRGVPAPRQLAGREWQLRALFYETREAFAAAAVARKRGNRPLDKETQMFLARQMVGNHPATVNGRLTELALTMGATQAYRAAEVGNPEDAAAALAALDRLIGAIGEEEVQGDRQEYDLISLRTARWHLAAAMGERDGWLATLEAIRARAATIPANERIWTLSYNTTRSFCVLLGWQILRGEVAAARATAEAILPILRTAAGHLTLYPAHVREFGATLRLVQPIELMLQAAEAEGDTPRLRRLVPGVRQPLGDAVEALMLRGAIRTDNAEALARRIRGWAES